MVVSIIKKITSFLFLLKVIICSLDDCAPVGTYNSNITEAVNPLDENLKIDVFCSKSDCNHPNQLLDEDVLGVICGDKNVKKKSSIKFLRKYELRDLSDNFKEVNAQKDERFEKIDSKVSEKRGFCKTGSLAGCIPKLKIYDRRDNTEESSFEVLRIEDYSTSSDRDKSSEISDYVDSSFISSELCDFISEENVESTVDA